MVEADQQARLSLAVRGGNSRQLYLDQRDRINAYAQLLEKAYGLEAATAFLTLYAEEATAATAHLQARTEQLEASNAVAAAEAARRAAAAAQSDATLRAIGSVVVTFALAFLFYLLTR